MEFYSQCNRHILDSNGNCPSCSLKEALKPTEKSSKNYLLWLFILLSSIVVLTPLWVFIHLLYVLAFHSVS